MLCVRNSQPSKVDRKCVIGLIYQNKLWMLIKKINARRKIRHRHCLRKGLTGHIVALSGNDFFSKGTQKENGQRGMITGMRFQYHDASMKCTHFK